LALELPPPDLLGQWYRDDSALPIVIAPITSARVAESVALELGEAAWIEDYSCRRDGKVYPVDRATFEAANLQSRAGFVEGLSIDEATTRCSLIEELVGHLCSRQLREMLSDSLREVVSSPPLLDLSRYRAHHFLAPHRDSGNRRCVALLLYFSNVPWRAGDGGEFGLRTSDLREFAYPPVENTALIMRFPHDSHWVRPVRTRRFTRYALTAHFMRDSAEGPVG
jgi:hypothetical protein